MNARAIKEANTDGIKAVASEVGLGASAVEALEGGAALADLVIGRGTPPPAQLWLRAGCRNDLWSNHVNFFWASGLPVRRCRMAKLYSLGTIHLLQ
ncbi:hypothetical protein GOBAR_AA03516 [Gossypium barbadense]|uniref:Uncharacterized protein n=1 Tax=Gossypium barbadense TaxID=3634 RepID=A0A2P5YNF1_GOSBA|nr:hypothetical protein GOBAR_AA03516 [Gossypium barbadense]